MTTRSTLSPAEADRAIYLDFEGTVVDPASFLGVAIEGNWHVYVIEEALQPACDAGTRSDVVEATTLVEALDLIRSLAEDEDRRVVAYSSRELEEIRSQLGPESEEAAWWEANLVDALPIARRWARHHGLRLPPRPTRNGARTTRWPLAGFMALVGYDVPTHLGPGNSASRIREVRRQLSAHGDFESLTTTAKGKWTKALDHNRHDCLGMAAVMAEVAADDNA